MEMEFQKPIIITQAATSTSRDPKPININNTSVTGTSSSVIESSSSSFNLCSSTRYESFRKLENYLPKTHSADLKLSWLRSQVIGGDVEFDSPFGKRRITYADHTASGRSLHYIESFIINNVLPFYGMYCVRLLIFIYILCELILAISN